MGDVMLHFEEALSEASRQAIGRHVEAVFGLSEAGHRSNKPYLMFLPCDTHNAVPHAVLEAVCAMGYRAELVDL